MYNATVKEKKSNFYCSIALLSVIPVVNENFAETPTTKASISDKDPALSFITSR